MPLKPEVAERLESIKNPLSRITAVIGLLSLALVLIWMNRYQYEHTGQTQMLVRINRFTGEQCFLLSTGDWDSRIAGPPPRPSTDKEQLDVLMFGEENKCH